MKKEYRDLVSAASDALSFGCTNLCKLCFPAMTAVKTKYWNKLNLESDLQITVLQSVKPPF